MAINQKQDEWAKSAIRLPKELHRQVHEAAKAEDRSFNGQLVAFIREGVQTRANRGELDRGTR